MKWQICASILLGENAIYRFIYQREVNAATAAEAITAVLQQAEEQEKLSVKGLWDLTAIRVRRKR